VSAWYSTVARVAATESGCDNPAVVKGCLPDPGLLSGHTMLVLEQDDTLIASDRKLLYEAARKASCAETLRYVHRRAAAEQLLALPDAVAWCWAKGGDWRTTALRPRETRLGL
jgi:hypothetical protein